MSNSKTCSKCEETKAKTEFNKAKNHSDGLRSYCRECDNKKSAEWYRANKDRAAAYNKSWINSNSEKRKSQHKNWLKANSDKQNAYRRSNYMKRSAFINAHKVNPCLDCGVKYPPYVMQFDHTRGKKLFTIGENRHRSEKQILEEIAKCDLVCANCHAERTYQRRQSKCSS